jgi:hypothetical protein
MQVSEYRVTMAHDNGTAKIVVTASSATTAVDSVVKAERAPRRSARLVEVRPLQFERTDDTWSPVPGAEWGRVEDQPVNVTVHTNPFAPDPRNPFTVWSSQELESARGSWATPHAEQFDQSDAVRKAGHVGEELARRADVDTAVELRERLCAVPFVRGETQGQYLHSRRHLDPSEQGQGLGSGRMPDAAELEALVLSDGEETAYPPHDAQPAYDPSIPDLTAEQRAETYYHENENPWSYGDRLYPVTLTLISCGDYHGSDVDAANNRALDGTPGVDVSEPNTGGMGSVFNVSTTVVGAMSSFENATDPGDTDREPAARRADALMWLESMVKQMEGLVDYALLDVGVWSEFVDELAEEAWDSWLESDTLSALQDLAPEDGTTVWEDVLDNVSDELNESIRDAYFGFEANDWIVSSLGEGATNGRHEETVKHVARTLFGWNL